jgi:hypothetical protein
VSSGHEGAAILFHAQGQNRTATNAESPEKRKFAVVSDIPTTKHGGCSPPQNDRPLVLKINSTQPSGAASLDIHASGSPSLLSSQIAAIQPASEGGMGRSA